jgi:hypothetical protein
MNKDELPEIGREVAVEAGEVVLDQLLEAEILKDIPVLGWFVKLAHARRVISDEIFLRKVVNFFNAQRSSQEERRKFREKLAHDPKLRRKVGEVLIVHLDNLNDLGKPELTARVFDALLAGKIGLTEFRRLADAIELGYVEDLTAVASVGEVSALHLSALVRTGLAEVALERSADPMHTISFSPMPLLTFRLSSLGDLFSRIMRDAL